MGTPGVNFLHQISVLETELTKGQPERSFLRRLSPRVYCLSDSTVKLAIDNDYVWINVYYEEFSENKEMASKAV